MTVAAAFRFPAGVYHATPWRLPANAAEPEWPPSPWRIVRALLSTWHTRLPDLPEAVVAEMVQALSSVAPDYLLPAVTRSQTRHYLPLLKHEGRKTGETTLTIDARLHIDPSQDLVVAWPVDLTAECREALARLLELLPYLGRAEASCEARLLRDRPESGTSEWARPMEGGSTQVLSPLPTVTLDELYLTPDAVRKKRLPLPPGAQYVSYDVPLQEEAPIAAPESTEPTAVRWAVMASAPFLMQAGVLATDRLRAAVLGSPELDDDQAWRLTGHGPQARSSHQHAHWLFLPNASDRRIGARQRIGELQCWCPAGVPTALTHRLTRVRVLRAGDWSPKGFVETPLHLTGVGRIDDLARDYVGPSADWVAVTPMTTARHRKSESVLQFWADEVTREMARRPHLQGVGVESVEFAAASDERVRQFRRYRWSKTMADAQPGAMLRVRLSRPTAGPIVLGSLSHFGLGLFRPEG